MLPDIAKYRSRRIVCWNSRIALAFYMRFSSKAAAAKRDVLKSPFITVYFITVIMICDTLLLKNNITPEYML